jgi:hypothetical protein
VCKKSLIILRATVSGILHKDVVKSVMNKRFVYILNCYIFKKYDILTEYLTLFRFAMPVNEYKLYVSIQKSSKDANFGQCLYSICGTHSVMSRTDAQSELYSIFKFMQIIKKLY